MSNLKQTILTTAKGESKEIKGAVRIWVASHPLTGVLIALAVGVVIGHFLF